jgi:DNA-binding transcriptional MerR regulator
MGYRRQGTAYERTYSQIDLDERRKIARWRQAGVSVDVIAKKLGRPLNLRIPFSRRLASLCEWQLFSLSRCYDVA